MKVGLQTWGTDGDFMPFLALAIGLRNAGHEVILAYTSVDGKDYSNRNDTTGIELIRANGNVTISDAFNPYGIDAKPGSFKEYTTLLDTYYEPYTEAMYNASEELCQKCDVVVGHSVCHTLVTASQKFNVPRVALVLTPIIVRSDNASPIGVNLGKLPNAFLWFAGGKVSTGKWFKQAKAIRKQQGLPAIKSLQKEVFTSDLLTIVAANENLAPRQSDWKDSVKISGFLNLPNLNNEKNLPNELIEFLDKGEPPVYMTFGSCMQFDLENSTSLLIEAAKLSGHRATIQSDWNSIQKPKEEAIFCAGRLPHLEVFPQCSAIIHHGGAGTTQAALLAGKPSIIVAHGFDQVYWANQISSQHLGGKPLLKDTITAEKLADEINAVVSNQALRKNALGVGQKMNQENGVNKAVRWIEELQKFTTA